MPSPAFGYHRKHRNHLRLLEHMMLDGAPFRLERASSLREVFEILRSYQSLGNFLAFQFAIDLNYSAMLDFSEMDFVVAGPGARSGIRKCFADSGGLDDADVIRAVTEMADREADGTGDLLGNLTAAHAWVAPFHLDHRSNQFAGGTFRPLGDRVDWSHIEDDICASPKPGEGVAVSKAWLSRPFYVSASAIPKAYRIQASADPTRSDSGPAAANVS